MCRAILIIKKLVGYVLDNPFTKAVIHYCMFKNFMILLKFQFLRAEDLFFNEIQPFCGFSVRHFHNINPCR